ncbi:MAG: T9SS type A sorting domain-containing protein [Ignavibacteria bacterium]|nr:T9SS type A sorting domain-containing protein [Ignavibacteria bacterium]
MKNLLRLILLSFIFAFTLNPGDEQKFPKILDDDNSKWTNIGNIGITVSNFGTYGHGFVLWPEQPSCEFPLGSGIEHLFDGGLYVGGFVRGIGGPLVTTAAVDAASVSSRGGGFEFTNAPGDLIKERSSLFDSRFFSPSAISHQDFLMDYVDTNTVFENGEPIIDHNPLGISIHQETYSWDFQFANFFVIFNYWIKNVSNNYIDSVFVGMWTDTVVRNTRITGRPSGSAFYNKGGNGYSDSIKVAYEFDAAGDLGFSDSYIGVVYCGSEPRLPDFLPAGLNDSIPTVNFVSWQFRNTDDPNFFAPQNDVDRYGKMRGFFGGTNRWKNGINPGQVKGPSNRSILITNGSFSSIAPGDSINVVFAIVCGKKFGPDPANLDTEEQKKNLYANADWALRAYHGEDRNRNGILDPGEDLDGDGKITRYILPAPPVNPNVKVVPKDRSVEIYWDKRSELSVDPISGKRDFEGYRLYRTQAGFDLTQSQDIFNSLAVLAEFDSAANGVGFDTGFEFAELTEPLTFPGDTIQYFYKFELANLLNGWQYLFSVTAFDEGDPDNNLESLESSPLANFERILPGTPASDDPELKIGVYPNPYYGEAIWDGSSERLRKIYFFNLPSDCEITIYTLAGDIVKRIQHTNQSNSSEIRWFETFASDGKQKFAGGEHAWDLLTDNEQAIATGMYLFTVKNNRNGDIKTGKFLVIK